MDGHKKKKPTKAELIASIPNVVNKELKDNFAKNMMQGFEVANQMMLDYINDGHNLDDIKCFIERNLSKEGKDAMMKVVMGGKDVQEES